MSQRVAELNHTQEVVDIVLSDGHVIGFAFLHYFARNLAANVTNFALQVTHASFPGIRADQRGNRVVGELQILFGESCLHKLFLHQELFGNFNFLLLGISVEAQYFHPILQSGRNGVHDVRGGNEEDLREVVFDVQIMVDEHEVLLRVEYLEQGRRRIATEVHRHLVDFIEHEDRILRARLLHHLNYLSRQCADIGAAVTTDFGFIAHPAERHANKLPSRCLGNRHPQ